MAARAKHSDEWVRLGASVRLAQLQKEVAEILKAYPEMRRGVPTGVVEARPKRRISAKARKAMRKGMRRYWAKRKAEGK